MRNIKIAIFFCCYPLFSPASEITYMAALSTSNQSNGAPSATVFSAVKDGNFEMAKLLIENGADVNISPNKWYSPLEQAVDDGNFEMAKLLIESGADVNSITGKHGPLHVVAFYYDYDVALQITELLIENGADVNTVNSDDFSPLDIVVRFKTHNVDLAELLIKNGADINRASRTAWRDDYHGFFPLHVAVYRMNIPMVTLLIESGADVNVKDKKGRTPLYYANRANRRSIGVYGPKKLEEIATLLRSAGADSDSAYPVEVASLTDGALVSSVGADSPTRPVEVASLTDRDLVSGSYAPFSLNRVEFGEEVFAHDNQHVKRWLTYFSTGPGREIMEIILERSSRYIDLMKDIFQEQDLPTDLVYMSMVESAFYPYARSRANAVGYWQFLESTGHHYGLRIDSEVDDRLDFALSTQAAGRYMRNMYNVFEDWLLSMAAYNCGQNCVLRAIKKHDSKDFWHLVENRALPRETRNYVPKVIAMKIIASDPSSYGFSSLNYQRPLEYGFIPIDQTAFLSDIAEDINVPYRVLKLLNSRFVSGVVSVQGEVVHIRVPADIEKL